MKFANRSARSKRASSSRVLLLVSPDREVWSLESDASSCIFAARDCAAERGFGFWRAREGESVGGDWKEAPDRKKADEPLRVFLVFVDFRGLCEVEEKLSVFAATTA